MVNYTALNETEDSGGSECVTNSSDNGDKETNPVNIQSFINYYSISFSVKPFKASLKIKELVFSLFFNRRMQYTYGIRLYVPKL